MAISSNSGGEYLDVKVFLYKYTPQFTFDKVDTATQQVPNTIATTLAPAPTPVNLVETNPPTKVTQSATETVEGLYQVIKYSIDLNAPKYFSKFDITQYAKGYQFSQGLYGNTYNWSINFQDAVVPFAQLSPSGTSTVRKAVSFRRPTGVVNETSQVLGPTCRAQGFPTQSGDLVDLMAQYEAESNWPSSFNTEVSIITEAYISRGTVITPYASNSQGNASSILNAPGSDIKFNNPQLDGLRLSDLVQKYNYVSVFVYKSSISPTQARKSAFPGGVRGANGTTRAFDPSNEVHLMLAGYKNEFNGFVTGKNFSRTPGQVDQLTVTGHGSLRLFSDTKTLYDPSILAGGVFEASTLNAITPSAQQDVQTEDTKQYFSLYQNLFQGKDPIQILTSLLHLVYKISFNAPVVGLSEYWGFYDTYQLVFDQSGTPLNNVGDSSALDASFVPTTNKAGNLITIAPFLLSLVMSLRNYNYNLETQLQTTSSGSSGSGTKAIVTGFPDNEFSPIDSSKLTDSNFAEEFGGPCVQISAVDKIFEPYFKMLKNGFNNYLSGLKSANEIMAEVTLYSLLEFYERPNGRIILRTPQYNQPDRTTLLGNTSPTGNMVTSSSVPIIQASYSEDGTQLQSQKRGSWSQDFVGGIGDGLIQPSFGNGKLMMQYGFREAIAEANPVLAGLARDKSAGVIPGLDTITALGGNTPLVTADINNIVHKYLRFLLEFDNAGLRVGALSLEGAPELEVGKLFFDYTNNKMGYIVDVQKQLTVGGTYTSSISLKFVRDIDSSKTVFRQLPTLEELVSAGTLLEAGAASTPIVEFPLVPQPRATGTNQAQIFSNLKSGLSANPFPSA